MLFGGKDNFGNFGGNLKKLGNGLSQFAGSVANIAWGDIDTAIEYLRKIVTATQDIAGVDTKAAADFKTATASLATTGWSGFIDGIKNGATKLFDTGKQLVGWTNDGVSDALPILGTSGASGSEQLISGYLSGAAAQAAAGTQSVATVADGIETALPLINAGGVDGYKEYVEGMLSNPKALKDAGSKLADNAATGAENNKDVLYTPGQNAAQGFIDGIKSMWQKVKNVGANLGNWAKQGATSSSSLNEHSPSKAFYEIGEYAVMGFNLALLENMRAIKKTSGALGNMAIEEVTSVLADLANTEGDMMFQPVIRPVLDLSELHGSTAYASDLLASLGSMDFVNRANIAMQVDSPANQNGALLDAIGRLDRQMTAMEASVSRLQRFADTGLGQSVGTAVAQALDGVSMNANGREIGKLAVAYQSGMQRRGGV